MKRALDIVTIVVISALILACVYGIGYEKGKAQYFWQPSSLNYKTPINVTVGYADGHYKNDYISIYEPANLHDWLINTALENATSANLTWNYTPFKEYGALTVNWEK